MGNEEILKMCQSVGMDVSINEDFSFDPLKGKYHAKVKSFIRDTGVDDAGNTTFDLYKLTMQIEETVYGDNGGKRFLVKKYWNKDSDYKTKEQSWGKMLSDIATIGVPIKITELKEGEKLDLTTDELFNASLIHANDMMVKCSCSEYNKNQVVAIVKEFKIPKKKEKAEVKTKLDEEVPF